MFGLFCCGVGGFLRRENNTFQKADTQTQHERAATGSQVSLQKPQSDISVALRLETKGKRCT